MKAFGRRPGQKGHFLQLSAKNVPWRFPPRSGQHAKAMATGTLSEGPWFRLNTETGTAPEKGQSRTSRAGANTSLPGNTRRKSAAYGASSVFWYFLARQKRANGFLGAKQNRNVQGTKGKFPAQRGCPPGISETSAPELVLALRKRAVRLPIPTSAVGTGLPAVASDGPFA